MFNNNIKCIILTFNEKNENNYEIWKNLTFQISLNENFGLEIMTKYFSFIILCLRLDFDEHKVKYGVQSNCIIFLKNQITNNYKKNLSKRIKNTN